MKSWLQDDDMEMHSTHNGVKSANIIIDKNNNTDHRTTKAKSVLFMQQFEYIYLLW